MENVVAHAPQTRLVVRSARSAYDFEAVRRMNDAVFAREIGQHEPSEDGQRIDEYEQSSRYYTAWRGDVLVGMVCYGVGEGRRFSIDGKLDDPSVIDQYRAAAVEIRLLAVTPGERTTRACWLMLRALAHDVVQQGYRYALISGIEAQQRLYRRAGFMPLAPPVQRGAARFTPMMLTLDRFLTFSRSHAHLDLLP